MSREAVPNSNHCIRVGTACDKGFGRSKPPPGTAGVRMEGSFPMAAADRPTEIVGLNTILILARRSVACSRHRRAHRGRADPRSPSATSARPSRGAVRSRSSRSRTARTWTTTLPRPSPRCGRPTGASASSSTTSCRPSRSLGVLVQGRRRECLDRAHHDHRGMMPGAHDPSCAG